MEVDGSQHCEPEQAAHDEARTRWLECEGFAVVRVWASFANLDGVLSAISAALWERPLVRACPDTPTRRAQDHLAPYVPDADRVCRGGGAK